MEAEVKGVGGTIKTKGTSLLASLGPYAGALSMLRRMHLKKRELYLTVSLPSSAAALSGAV